MRKIHLLSLVLAMSVMLFSCGDDGDDNPTPSTTTPTGDTPPTKPSSRDGNANSDLRTGSFDLNGNTFQSPSGISTAKGKHNIGKLTQTTRKNGSGKVANEEFAWLVDAASANGSAVDVSEAGLDLALFFLDDGTYDVYYFDEDEWDWGYWYGDEDASLLVFDPETEDELFFDILSLSSTSMTISATDDEGNNFELELNAYVEGEGEETTDIDEATVAAIVADKFWELEGGGTYNEDGDFVFVTEGIPDVTAYFDSEDGDMFLAAQQGTIDFGGTNAPEIEFGSFDFDISNFEVTLNYQDGSNETLYLLYADAEILIFAIDDDEDGYIEFLFTPFDDADFSSTCLGVDYEELGTYDLNGDLTITQVDYAGINFGASGTAAFSLNGDFVEDLSYTYTSDPIPEISVSGTALNASYVVAFYNENCLMLYDETEESTICFIGGN